MEQQLQELRDYGRSVADMSEQMSLLLTIQGIPEDIIRESFNRLSSEISMIQQVIGTVRLQHRREVRNIERQRVSQQLVASIELDPVSIEQHPALEPASELVVRPRRVCIPRMKKPVFKTLKKADFGAIMPDNCGICLETKTRGETITTCCGHNYCKTCFEQLVESRKNRQSRADRVVHCPHCRKENPQVTAFKTRKPRTQTAVILPVTQNA